ncbi:putative alpha/beta hydrolase [Mycolicibacterium helvum]|uniref:Predicted hydrolase N-terminal domain-containing protein n=1 Tax=Mycolicibacterium helvum TaxID=1534349 RepID=A0A7I7T2J0_9MYCO|nr:hypothetical protein [Mycolicibacterium helvum]BBY63514.1 hypothetical protein MHEL_17570 [Mycolicibacterium helvum]
MTECPSLTHISIGALIGEAGGDPWQVDTLNTELHYLDALIDQALTHDQDTSALEDNAISMTSSALHQVEALRDDYGAKLEASLTDLRAKDEALVNSNGPMTQEKADATARLRDFTTATNPAADPDARRLAGERLDDFRMANFVGPLPKDPILGGDARTRARSRLDLQRQLQQGRYGLPDVG